MLIDNMSSGLLEDIYQHHMAIMKAIEVSLRDETKMEEHKKYYNSNTHWYLMKNAWEILLPIPREEWNPAMLRDFSRYSIEMPWPQSAAYQYGMEVLNPPGIPSVGLRFGYAILEDASVQKTCFYSWQKMVKYQVAPQGTAMDPLAVMHKIPVKYYVGVPIEAEDLANFITKKVSGNPLENYLERTHYKQQTVF